MTINGTSNYNTTTSHKANLYKTTLKQRKYNIFNKSPKYLSYFSSIYHKFQHLTIKLENITKKN